MLSLFLAKKEGFGPEAIEQLSVLYFQLTIGKSPATGEPGPPRRRSKFERLKAGVVAFLAVSGVIGVLLAALVLGSVLAIGIFVLVLVAISVWLVSRFWHHGQPRGKAQP